MTVAGGGQGETGVAKRGVVGRDYIGKRGEAIATERLMDFCGNPIPYFDPHFLGEKCPTYDLLVELVGAGHSSPYFLAQVKATGQGYTQGGVELKVAVKAKDVQKMVGCPIPTYIIGIDEPAAKAFIVSVHGPLSKRVSTIPTSYPLDPGNLKRLWDEVKAYWTTLGGTAKAKTSAFTF
jgi:hypothetical protein